MADLWTFDSLARDSKLSRMTVRGMENWAISLQHRNREVFGHENHTLVQINNFMNAPETAISNAALQKFAKITPQYPGIRAPLPHWVSLQWLAVLSPMLDETFGKTAMGWEIRAWYSLVTTPPEALIPMQRFPHVDGTNPDQLAMMLYLHHTDQGGTGFFRHRRSGLAALTDATYPQYSAALEQDVRENGLPPAAYVTDGAPFFELEHSSDGAFNQAVFYRGNLLHSGLIRNPEQLSADPAKGRLTINAFFRPAN